MIPPFLARDQTMRAVYDATAQEFDVLDTYMDELQRNIIPKTASEHLDLYEWLLNLTIKPGVQTVPQRLATVLAFLQRLTMNGSGFDWESVITAFVGTGWSYKTNIPGDGTTPPANTVSVTLPYASGTVPATLAGTLLRQITPANTVITVVYSDTLTLDATGASIGLDVKVLG